MKMHSVIISGVFMALAAVVSIFVFIHYSLHIGLTPNTIQPKTQANKDAPTPKSAMSAKPAAKPLHTDDKTTNLQAADITPQPEEFYTDITKFDRHLDGLTNVDPQYVRSMRDFLEKRIRLNYPVAWPYHNNPDVMAFENDGDMMSNRGIAGANYGLFEDVRYQIGMTDGDTRSKNNAFNCSVIVCDMSGKRLAILSRLGYYSPDQEADAEAGEKYSESIYPQQEPAMKRAAEIRMMQVLLMQKETAIGSNYIQQPLDAEHIVDSPRMRKILKKLRATFVHTDFMHGEVTFPDYCSTEAAPVELNHDGKWNCTGIPLGLRAAIIQGSSYRRK